MYCHYCKARIDNDSLYCKHCGRQVVLDSEQMLRPVRRRRKPVVALVLILLLLMLAAAGGWAVSQYAPDLIPSLLLKVGIGDGPDVLPTVLAAPTLVPGAGEAEATSGPGRTPRPVTTEHGKIVTASAYRGVCPVRVKANGSNMLVVLVYQGPPDYSAENREPLDAGVQPEEDSLAFYVSGGQTAEVSVPIGVYRLYYACGKEYYNRSLLFGESTRRYTLNSLIICARNGKTYSGTELTLHSTGGSATEAVPASRFPQN